MTLRVRSLSTSYCVCPQFTIDLHHEVNKHTNVDCITGQHGVDFTVTRKVFKKGKLPIFCVSRVIFGISRLRNGMCFARTLTFWYFG